MLQLDTIHIKISKLVNELIIEQWRLQGHSMTGAFEASLSIDTSSNSRTNSLSGLGLKYGKEVNDGYKPEQVNKNMIPGLIEYFIKRGFNPVNAQKAANFTYLKWKKEGMSTQASKKYSATGERQHFIERALENPIIDRTMDMELNSMLERISGNVKSETI